MNCPKCQDEIENWWERYCWNCKTEIYYCKICNLFSEVECKQNPENIEYFSNCPNCKNTIFEELHFYKSSIYNHYQFAFKFENRNGVRFHYKFNEKLPFAEHQSDIGIYENDFGFLNADWCSRRAYKVELNLEDEKQDCIVMPHESGLEVFLIAVGTFIGIETSKFILKRTLEKIEESINAWLPENDRIFMKNKNEEPNVVAIKVRTKKWEITIDGKFSTEEREKLFDLFEKKRPIGKIEKFIGFLQEKQFEDKVIKTSKKINKFSKKK
jgi:hypothetical protein